jgi:hypothetical protein
MYAVYARTRFLLTDRGLRAVVPTWHGHLPTPPMREFTFAPGQLLRVEVRDEVRRTLGATLIGPALLLEAAGSERVFAYRCLPDKLGALPLRDIAAAIGRRMNCPVNDRGLMEVGAWRTGDDTRWTAPSLDPGEAAQAKSAAARYAKIAAAILGAAIALQVLSRLLR